MRKTPVLPAPVKLGDFVEHPALGRGILLSMSSPPFAYHYVERWDGRGRKPTRAKDGFVATSRELRIVEHRAGLIRRTRLK